MGDTAQREKPLLIFDGKCGLCRIWVDCWKARADGKVDFAASQDVADQFPQIPTKAFAGSVQLVLPDGEVLSGARAVYQLLTYSHDTSWPLAFYDGLPGFGPLSELAYRIIARHRSFFYWVTALLFGKSIRPVRYGRIEWIFLRLLALIYLDAFLSLGVQILGLIGSRGISPVERYLPLAAQAVGAARAWRIIPTIFWLGHSDTALIAGCIAGAAIALVLLAGFFERTCLVLLFVLYLSFCSAAQEFLSYQWDFLLLEAGFLAIFLGGSNLMVWMFRLLVFRLMFSSGAVKLLSGDPTWRNLTALNYHYFTQPLPTPLAWYMAQLPGWFQRFSTAGVFFVELLTSLFIFLPRRLRLFGAACLILLQVLILTTGNYAFFNGLSIALCLFVLDDHVFPSWVRDRRVRAAPRGLAISVATIVIMLGTFNMIGTLGGRLPRPAAEVQSFFAPFGIVNSYGLFAVMTTARIEITVEGSNDGERWLAYDFKYKPGPLNRPPPIVAPHQPRLDWQMWFAALNDTVADRWFVNFMARLMQNSPDVLGLLRSNPFPNAPPRYVRALKSSYTFTDWAERRRTGNWWKSTPAGVYMRAISLSGLNAPASGM